MGDELTILSEAEARHFLRRTGFGEKPSEVSDLVGATRGQAADRALAFRLSKRKFAGGSIERAQAKWFHYMLSQRTPGLQEKLVLFFHDHFATSNAKVENVKSLSTQIRTRYTRCRGSFRDLVKASNRDAAMIEFIDTVRNR